MIDAVLSFWPTPELGEQHNTALKCEWDDVILAIDQGTSGTKALVVCPERGVIGTGEAVVRCRYGPGGSVEIDPRLLLDSVIDAGRQAIAMAGEPVSAVGLANQGETVLAWDPATGAPLTAAIGWQDRRASTVCAQLTAHAAELREITGLPLDPYFAAPKMAWAGPRVLDTTSPAGRERITATAVVLATGARERPRSARWIPGDRPSGVLTTGQLQQAAHYRQPIGRRVLIVGAAPVSYCALHTLRRAGVEVVAMVTELPRHQSHLAAHLTARFRHRVPLLTEVTVTGVVGRNRVESVTLQRANGRTTTISCDTVVFTGDWIPDHELARGGAITLDSSTQGPAVDTALRTYRPGVFTAGDLLHPGETARTATLSGRAVARSVLRYLTGQPWPVSLVPVHVDQPLRWVSPNRIASDGPRHRFLVRTSEFLTRPLLLACQDGHVLQRVRMMRTLVPNRTCRLSADWIGTVNPAGGPVRITVKDHDHTAGDSRQRAKGWGARA